MDTTRPSLLLRIRDRGDTDAWRLFDALYRPMLERFARARGLSAADAEDVAQHCLAQIADHIAEFTYNPAQGRFKGWLRTLVNNRIRSLVRGHHERQGESRDFEVLPTRETAPDADFERIWLEEHLWHCLRELQREVEESTYRAFQAYVIEQQPIDAVCAATGLTAQNVYTIKWRLTERIAAKMRELVDGLE